MEASGKNKKNIKRRSLANVIEPRMEELFDLINNELHKAGPRDMTPAGLVVTGGASLIEDATNLATDLIELPVRLGEPSYISGLSDVIDNPVYIKKDKKVPKAIFSTAVGLIEYGSKYEQDTKTKKNSQSIVNDFFNKLKTWFEDFF